MADNTTLNNGSGGDTIRTEDRTTYKTPVTLLDVGGTSSEALIGDGTNTLPVDLPDVSGTDGVAGPAEALSVAGTESGGNLQELRVDSDGHLQVDVLTQGVEKTDDISTHTSGTDTGTPVMAVATPTDTTVNANDYGHLAMSVDRRLLIDAQISGQDADITIADGGNSITVDGTVTANAGTGTFTVDLGANNDVTIDGSTSVGTDGSAHGASQTGMRAMGTDGTNDQQIAVDATGNVQVDIVADAAGLATSANQSTANSSLSNVDTNTSNTATNTTDIPNVIGTDGGVGPTKTLSVGGTESGGNIQEVRVDSDGHLQVDVLTGGGAGTERTDDTDTHTAASDVGTAIMGVATPTDPTVDANDYGHLSMSLDRRLLVDAQIAGQDADVTIADGGNSITVDGTITANAGTGTMTVDLGANNDVTIDGSASIGTDAAAHGASQTGMRVMGTDGTNDQQIAVDATGNVQVDIVADGAGLATSSNQSTANTSLGNIDTNTTNIPNVIGTDGGVGPTSVLSVGGTESGGNIQEVRVDSDGHLQVDVLTGGGSGTERQDDTDTHTGGTDVGTAIMGVATPTDTVVDANDYGHVAMSTDRRLLVDAQLVGQDADITIADGGNTITVDGTVTANAGTGTMTVDLGANNDVTIDGSASVGTDAAAHGASQTGLRVMGSDGTNDQQIAVDASGNVQVDIVADASGLATDSTASTIATNTNNLNNTIGTDGLAGPTAVMSVGGTESGGNLQEVRVDSDGHLQVDVLTGGGGGTERTDDTDTHTAASDVGTAIMAVATPTDTTVDANDYGHLSMSTDRRLLVDAQLAGQDADITIADGGNTITVDNGGTFAVQSATAGDVAHDTADSGNPVKIGGKVETSTAGATLAADGDRTDIYADSDGSLITRTNHPLGDLLHNRVSDTAGTSANFTGDFSAAGASIKNYVSGITIANTSETPGYVDFRDGSAGSVLWTVPIPANGGVTLNNGGHPLFATTANTALAYDVSAALSTVYISVSGFTSKV